MRNMRIKIMASAVLALSLVCGGVQASPEWSGKEYRQALELYENGMYERARSLFETMSPDPLADGYAVLCALKMKTDDCRELVFGYDRRHAGSALSDRIRFEYARLLFDDGQYAEAALEFSKVSSSALSGEEMPEYLFKCGYCAFSLGEEQEALRFFTILDAMEYSEYSAPGKYLSGVIFYGDERFAEAEACFWKASADPRFKDLTDFYIVDCEFNQKNYEFAVREGERVYASATPERRQRLARIISEASLILGDVEKARRYYEGLSHEGMNRKDYFYSATVLYSVHDYKGAIENYLKMTDRTDSLGQVANYYLANSYLRTGNQVAAMSAFQDASALGFDPEITEDASFNYAKLAFDLNKDTSGFTRYVKRYSTKARGVRIYGYMALAALYDRDYAAAVAAYDNIDYLEPDMRNNYTKANFLRAGQLFASGSYRDAVPYFKATAYYLPKTDMLNQYSRYWLGESYYRTGDFAEAGRTFTELYNGAGLDGKREGVLLPYNIGYSHFKQGDYDAASRWFDVYIATGSPLYREDAMNRRADCDFGRHDYKAAVDSYQKVLSEFFSPDDIYPYYQQALSSGLAGDKKRKVAILRHVESASAEAPMYFEAYYELGRAQMDIKAGEDAIRSFTHLRNTAKDKVYVAKALGGLGMVHRNMSKYDAALECYKEVVSLMPGSEYAEEALLAIESIYQTRRQPEKFLEYMEANSLNASKTEAEREKMYFNTAEQLYLSSSYDQAVPAVRKFLETFPQSAYGAQAKFYLAESYRVMGDKEKACDVYAEVMEASSEMSFVEMSKLRYADLSYELERYQNAYSGYSALLGATRLDANRSAARKGMMRSAYRSKDYESAIKSADAVLAEGGLSSELTREARYVRAKSCLATSRRDEAMELFRILGAEASTREGAEARYVTIQNLFDRGDFEAVESEVYSFSQTAGNQSYWLARAYLVLGDSFAERGRYEQAKATFESIRDGYAPSDGQDDIADSVRMRLERLETLIQK